MGNLQAATDLTSFSTQELIDLLLNKTTELLSAQEKKKNGIEIRRLLQEVEELTSFIKQRKEQEKLEKSN